MLTGRSESTASTTLRILVVIAVTATTAAIATSRPAGADANEGAPGTPRGAASVITAGFSHTCALLANGTVKCWGDGGFGKLGQGNTDSIGDDPDEMGDNLDPVDLGTGRTATAITTGTHHTCALLDNGTVKCWGDGVFGKLGQDNIDSIGDDPNEMGDNLDPVDLGTGRTATAITAGGNHTCALLDDATVKCWGAGAFGRLGQGDIEAIGDDPNEMGDNLDPVDLGTGRTATAITAGGSHTCALLDDHTVKCWGNGISGGLGQGDSDDIGDDPNEMGDNLDPVDLGTGRTATAITAVGNHTCALLDDHTVKCWGDGGNGRLGQGHTSSIGDDPNEMGDNLAPISLGTGRTATAITAGSAYTCALLDNHTVKCWGAGNSGRLGLGDTDTLGDQPGEMGDFLAAVSLGAGRIALAVTTGSSHTCALLDDGAMKCWGSGGSGRLGQGNTDNIGDGVGPAVADTAGILLGTGSGNLVVPVTVAPAAPTGSTAVAGAESAAVSWSTPGDDGGAAVTGYRVQSSTDGVTWTTEIADTGTTATSHTITGLTPGEAIRFRVAAINTAGIGASSTPTGPVTPNARYEPLDPARLLDTRPGGQTIDGQHTPGTRLVGGDEIALQVTGRAGVPDDADAVVLNVTVNEPDLPGFITAYPCGTSRPNASNLNYVAGQTIPNTVISKTGTGGQVCLYSDQTTHLIADVNGAFPTGTGYTPLDPARLLDTRPGTTTIDDQHTPGTKLVGGQEIALQVTGRAGVPDDADAVALNVTVNEADQAGFITAYPCGTPRPNASNLNYVAGQTIPNTVITKTGTGGQVCLYSDQTTHLIADVNGAFPTGTGYTPLDPARLLDTRPGTTTIDSQHTPGTKLVGGQEIALQVTGRAGVPDDADAVALNVTVNEADQAGFITAYPCGTPRPNASNLNYVAGQTIPNTVITKTGTTGQICLYSDQTTHLIADINGAF